MRQKHLITLLATLVMLAGIVLVFYGENHIYISTWMHVRQTVRWKQWKPPSYSVQWQRVRPCSTQVVAFIIMTSSVTKELHLAQRRTWLRDATHVWAFSDEYDGLFVHTLPSLHGKTTYQDAQHRQLRGMQWLYRNKKKFLDGVQWFFLIDDDTWVNMPVFSRALALLDSNSSVLCGYQHENGMFNGGAGILLSRQAFETITPRLYSDTCLFIMANDNTVTECARRSNVTMMHSGLFSFYPSKIESSVDFIEQITVHPVKDYALVEAMTHTSEIFYSK